MARNGSGTYALASGNPVVTGTSISSTWANNTLNDVASALTQSVSNDGQTPITANLPMTGFKHTNVANAAARTEYCAAGQAQDNTFDWLTSVAGTDTITASAAIGLAAYAAGQTFRFVAAGANTTTSVTLNLNSLGAKAVTKNGSTALAVGDIPSGCVVEVVYDGTRFQLVGVAVNYATTAGTATSATSATSATTATTATNIASGAAGSVPYQSGAGTTAMLAAGTNGQILTLAAGVPAWTNNTSIGTGQSWSDVKASRAMGFTYTNNTGRTIHVEVGVTLPSGGGAVNVVRGALSSVAANNGSGTNIVQLVSFPVIPLGTYAITVNTGSPSINSWLELS